GRLERAVIVALVAHLPVGMIEPARQPRDDVRVGQRAAGNPILGKLAAARMAQAAGLDLLAQGGGRDAALPVAGARIDRPGDVLPLVEAGRQPFRRVLRSAERTPALLVARPGNVPRSLAVAGLAADADLRKGGGEPVAGGVVVLAHAGGVALGAHEVPVLVQPGPMQDVVVLDLFVGIEMEPALA